MSESKFIVGRSYKTRAGRTAIISGINKDETHGMTGTVNGTDFTWTTSGRFWHAIGEEHDLDIIADDVVAEPAALTFEIGKKYKTRCGETALLTGFDGIGDFQIRGFINTYYECWLSNGSYNSIASDHPRDLMPGAIEDESVSETSAPTAPTAIDREELADWIKCEWRQPQDKDANVVNRLLRDLAGAFGMKVIPPVITNVRVLSIDEKAS